MNRDKDIRLIVRTGRRVKITKGENVFIFHIRAIVDNDQVVVRRFDRTRSGCSKWMYRTIDMLVFEMYYKEGKLS